MSGAQLPDPTADVLPARERGTDDTEEEEIVVSTPPEDGEEPEPVTSMKVVLEGIDLSDLTAEEQRALRNNLIDYLCGRLMLPLSGVKFENGR